MEHLTVIGVERPFWPISDSATYSDDEYKRSKWFLNWTGCVGVRLASYFILNKLYCTMSNWPSHWSLVINIKCKGWNLGVSETLLVNLVILRWYTFFNVRFTRLPELALSQKKLSQHWRNFIETRLIDITVKHVWPKYEQCNISYLT